MSNFLRAHELGGPLKELLHVSKRVGVTINKEFGVPLKALYSFQEPGFPTKVRDLDSFCMELLNAVMQSFLFALSNFD